MSIFFVTRDGRDVWNPSHVAGRLFCDQVESAARVLGVASGLAPIVSDEVIIDDARFIAFVDSFSDLFRRADPASSLRVLTEGCLSIAAALTQKLGSQAPSDPTIASLVAKGGPIVK